MEGEACAKGDRGGDRGQLHVPARSDQGLLGAEERVGVLGVGHRVVVEAVAPDELGRVGERAADVPAPGARVAVGLNSRRHPGPVGVGVLDQDPERLLGGWWIGGKGTGAVVGGPQDPLEGRRVRPHEVVGQLHLGDGHLRAVGVPGFLPGGQVQVVLGRHLEVEVLHRRPAAVGVLSDQTQIAAVDLAQVERVVVVRRGPNGRLLVPLGLTGEEDGLAAVPAVVVVVRLGPVVGGVVPRDVVAPGGIFRHEHLRGRGQEGIEEVVLAGRSAELGADRPVLSVVAGRVEVDLGQGEPRAIGLDGPGVVVAIRDGVDQSAAVVAQIDPLACVRELAVVGAQGIREPGLVLQQGRIRSHHEGSAGDNDGPLVEGVGHAPVERPARKVHVEDHGVVQFDPLEVPVEGRVVEDLVEADRARRGRLLA